jgi:hypothetical protein
MQTPDKFTVEMNERLRYNVTYLHQKLTLKYFHVKYSDK